MELNISSVRCWKAFPLFELFLRSWLLEAGLRGFHAAAMKTFPRGSKNPNMVLSSKYLYLSWLWETLYHDIWVRGPSGFLTSTPLGHYARLKVSSLGGFLATVAEGHGARAAHEDRRGRCRQPKMVSPTLQHLSKKLSPKPAAAATEFLELALAS